MKALSEEKDDVWALEQVFGLAALYARQGYHEARKAIYKRKIIKILTGSVKMQLLEALSTRIKREIVFDSLEETRALLLTTRKNNT